MPADALALLPGEGEVGAALVARPARAHDRLHRLLRRRAGDRPHRRRDAADGQRHLKRVIAEMGGKNCVIVDADADLDEVVPALVKSAFVYAGQKCSAAARVLCHEAIHDALVERLAGAVDVLEVGQAERLDIDVPPVIEREAQERVARYAAEAERPAGSPRTADGVPGERLVRAPDRRRRPAGRLARAARGDLRPAARRRARARRRRRVRPRRRLAVRAHRRPVRAQPRHRRPRRRPHARSATSTSTGRSPARWSRASRSAATASRAPGTKAGGPGYLLQFVEPRVVTENTMRHGLVV